jgi:hypothetical protein
VACGVCACPPYLGFPLFARSVYVLLYVIYVPCYVRTHVLLFVRTRVRTDVLDVYVLCTLVSLIAQSLCGIDARCAPGRTEGRHARKRRSCHSNSGAGLIFPPSIPFRAC